MATFSDNFNRADVDLSSDSPAWLTETSFYTLRILSNQITHNTGGGFGVAARRYPTACDTLTQFGKITLAVANTDPEAIGVIVRASGAGTFYNLGVGVDFIGIEKYVSGSYTAINGGTGQYTSVTNNVNDVFELRVVTNGSDVELRVYKNGSLVTGLGSSGVLTDSSGLTTGDYVGVFGYSENGTSVIRGDNWEGGDYTEGGGDPAPSVTDVDSDESITSTQAGWDITGTDFDTATVEIRQGSTTVAQTVNSQNSTTINCDTVFDDGAGPHLKYGSATAAVINGDDQEDTIAISIAVPTGRAYVDIGTPNTTAANRITAVDDIATGDQLEISNVIGGTIADVTLSDDATFSCDEAVDSFDVRVWDASDSTWGNIATQDVGDPVEDAEPVFIGPSAGTIVTLVDAAMSSIDFSARFTHATDSLTYELTGTLPTGVSFTTDTLAGTPTETGTFSGLVVTATDENTDTATSDTFTIRVVDAFSAGAAYGSLTFNDFAMRI